MLLYVWSCSCVGAYPACAFVLIFYREVTTMTKIRGVDERRRDVDTDHPALRINDAVFVVRPTHAAGTAGMVGAFHVLPDVIIERVVRLHGFTR